MNEQREAFDALARFLVAETSAQETLDAVAGIALRALPSARMVGMSMNGTYGEPATRVFTDPDAPDIDDAQYRSGLGPCLDAWRTGAVVRVDDVSEATERYPEFAAACRRCGIGSTLSTPMLGPGGAIGALNFYAPDRDAFGEREEVIGSDLAAASGAVVANSAAYWGAFELSEQLDQAMRSRATIEQAKGMLMAGSPAMTPDEAFEALVAASRRESVKLREVAQRIVDRQYRTP